MALSVCRHKVLVTGGAGFIGSHLCERLLCEGHEVICLDNFFTGSCKNIAHLVDHPYFLLIEHNIQKPFYTKVDWIFNLACPASPVHYQKEPVETVRTNVLGMINVLDLAKKTGARVLQASTSEVYGDPLEHPQKESYAGNVNPISRRACYDEGKRCAETLCFDYHRKHDVDICLVRIFNTYGPRMAKNDGRVISNFILQALQNKDISIYGNGSFTRSFQYVDDTVDGLVGAMEADNFTGPVNIGNPNEITILDVAKQIIKLTKSLSRIKFYPSVESDPRRRCPDITFAIKKLGWKPKIKFVDGLQKTIEYFKKIN